MKKGTVLTAGLLFFSIYTGISGELSMLSKKETLEVHGSTGASFTFNRSNDPMSARPPVDWNLYGNYSLRFLGLDLPFSFIINQNSQHYTHPFTQFGISPSFKWVKAYLGTGNIGLSGIDPSGHDFNGIGVELTPGKLHFSAFYGQVKTENYFDTSANSFDKIKFSGTGYGVKLGFGSTDKYFDISYFHSKNDQSPDQFYLQMSAENELAGMDYKISLNKIISLTGSFAVSGSTEARQTAGIDSLSYGPTSSKYKGIFSSYHSGNIPPWALEASFSIDLKNFRSLLIYRNERADFISPGTLSGNDHGQTISLSSNLSLAKGKLNINTRIVRQENDERKESTGELDAFFMTGDHTVSGNMNYRMLRSKDVFTGGSVQNENLSASLRYDWHPAGTPANISLSALYNHFGLPMGSASTFGATMNTGLNVLKNKILNLSGTVGYDFNRYNPGDSKGSFSFAFDAGYQPGRNAFHFFIKYALTPNDKRYELTSYIPYRTTTYNLTAGISYSSSF